MRILILGAGGIGGYFGGRLVQAGADVTFLVREARAKRLAASGLVIESPQGDARLAVKTASQDALDGHYDLVILSCKAYDLDTAIAAIKRATGPSTTILPLLNGLAHLDALEAAFGADHVIGGVAQISVGLAEDGTIRHYNKLETLIFGERDGTTSPRCEAIAALFDKAAFRAVSSATITQDLWEKFAFITAASAITSLMRADVGAIMAAADGERLVRAMLGDCEAVAAAAGFPMRAKMREMGYGLLTERGSAFKASMLRDIEAGGKVEADHLQGDMIRRGKTLGVATDLLAVAYCHLKAYQDMRSRA